MNFRLLFYKFTFLDNRYFFPIIINYDDKIKSTQDEDLLKQITDKLSETPGIEKLKLITDKIDSYPNLKSEFNDLIGDLNLNNYKTINVELRKVEILPQENLTGNAVMHFKIKKFSIPIRKLDNYEDFNTNPYIIIEMN